MHSATQRRIILLVVLLGGAAACYRWWTAEPVAADEAPVAMTRPRVAEIVPPDHAGHFTFLALGDSYTIGEGVAPADRWPVQAAAVVRGAGIDLGDPAILARTGWTTGDLLSAMDAAPLAKSYDCVTLMIGVNNEFRHQPVQQFRVELQTLLDRAIALAGAKASRVIVLSIPDWGVTPYGLRAEARNISPDIDQFNAVYRELTEKAGARWVDVTPITRQVANDSISFAADGLHPSPKQYTAWAALAVKAIEDGLK